MSNILQAFINIVNNYDISINEITTGNNRINNMGDGLESFIQDAFANTFEENNKQKKLQIFEKVFSYQGNKNNPPDLILKNSDAIEIKKLQSKNSDIALNSSYPKSKLYANSPMITKVCKNCEDKEWNIKDMIYSIGYIPKENKSLKSLWFIYGDCFCANSEIYERIKTTISKGINLIENVEFTPTNELGKVKKIDPLGVTDLRIRGMWHIKNPNKIFDYIYDFNESKNFQLIAIVTEDKYNSMPLEDRKIIENIDSIKVKTIEIKNPNNPVKLLKAKKITFEV